MPSDILAAPVIRVSRTGAANARARSYSLAALPDPLDFRDRMYEATLVDVPMEIPLEKYQEHKVPVLDQGHEGACTGFGLATVVHYLLRTRGVRPNDTAVSARMIYEMAKRHDEWPGEAYEGSSARGAMKGWHKHGVCSGEAWPYDDKGSEVLTDERARNARTRPLGAYSRVNHLNLVEMHAAIAEAGVLYASAKVHDGWSRVGADGFIAQSTTILGGHAFAIVGYDDTGFWIQNSWGTTWGKGGFGRTSYDDWLENGSDVWVARLGVPVRLSGTGSATANSAASDQPKGYSFQDIRPHLVSVGNDGAFKTTGQYGTSEADLREILTNDFPRITASWKKKRLLLYAHGGLTPEESAVQRMADYRTKLLSQEIYPLGLIWRTDLWSTLSNILEDAKNRRRDEGWISDAKNFVLDRLDDALEPVARMIGGHAVWSEMKENAQLATSRANGALRAMGDMLATLLAPQDTELHMVSHSAGSIIHSRLAEYLTQQGEITNGPLRGVQGLNQKIESLTLWAPACEVALFDQAYRPGIQSQNIKRCAIYLLTDKAEKDDNCANIYNKSLLYLVSNAFEERTRIPVIRNDGAAILGMEKFLPKLPTNVEVVHAPNMVDPATRNGRMASDAHSHGGFDDDDHTLQSTLRRILGSPADPGEFQFKSSSSKLREVRKGLADD